MNLIIVIDNQTGIQQLIIKLNLIVTNIHNNAHTIN